MREYIHFHSERGCLWVTPKGKMTYFAEPGPDVDWKALQLEISLWNPPRVIVDLRHMSHLGSTVLEWLVVIWKRVREKGGTLVLFKPTEVGREVLHLARFDTIWPIVDSVEEAVGLALGEG
jgi:anti-anti-sigma factor